MKEVGYAHSSDDRQDNTTCWERRGIGIDVVFKERSTFTLGEALEKKRKSQMSDEKRVRDFQRKLYRKAKQEESYKFYILYDKIMLPYVLRESYKRCKRNGGSAGEEYLSYKLHRHYKKKSQRKSRLCNQGTYKILLERFGLVKVTNWPKLLIPVNA